MRVVSLLRRLHHLPREPHVHFHSIPTKSRLSTLQTDVPQNLWDDLEIEVPKNGRPIEKPDGSALDEFERTARFILPMRFKEFVRVFGPGELGQGFLIKAPGCSNISKTADLQIFTERTRDALRGNYPDDVVLARLWYFCKTTGADLIGWDPDDISDEANREYRIYIKVHERSTAELLCDDLSSFVEDVCFGVRLEPVLGTAPDESRKSVRRFRPALR